MRKSHRGRVRAVSLLAVATASTLVLAGCGGSSDSNDKADAGSGPCGTTAKTTVTVGLFGSFGFKRLRTSSGGAQGPADVFITGSWSRTVFASIAPVNRNALAPISDIASPRTSRPAST